MVWGNGLLQVRYRSDSSGNEGLDVGDGEGDVVEKSGEVVIDASDRDQSSLLPLVRRRLDTCVEWEVTRTRLSRPLCLRRRARGLGQTKG